MNEETIIEKRSVSNGQNETENKGGAWKYVTLGGVSGILMGAGLMYAGQATAATTNDVVALAGTGAETIEEAAVVDQQTSTVVENSLPVAQMHNDLSFGEAFAAARAEVGPGGVFVWHGGIYNTFTTDEWNAMNQAQKNDFAHMVNPEAPVQSVSTPTDAQPNVVVLSEEPTATPTSNIDVDNDVVQSYEALANEDVHIVGYANVEGHLAVGYDIDGDGNADVAIIDVGEPGLSDEDVIMDRDGNMTTLGELDNEQDPDMMTASMENPDVAPDMPDYMNDAVFEA